VALYLEKDKTTSTPYVLIDEANSYLKFKGQCFHENIGMFFKDIIDWLNAYLETDFKVFTFDNEITYLNSTTAKILYDMLQKLDKYTSENRKIIVNWITFNENEIMIECGEDFSEDIENLEFNLIIKEREEDEV